MSADVSAFLSTALTAARAAGALLREHFGRTPQVNEFAAHDIKLELDVRAQGLITDTLLGEHPEHAILGEEGTAGNAESAFQWIVDPLDGTVNYFYGIPHFCTSIALRETLAGGATQTLVGVIYDPMRDELWAADSATRKVTMNDAPIRVSERTRMGDAIISVGMAKVSQTIAANMPVLVELNHSVRKCRMMGSAALDLAYVACGRLDAYIEAGISIWDVAAGILLVENAGGAVTLKPREDKAGKFSIVATSGEISELTNRAWGF
jgi:myo-inositol-1(or 4)-monophosphatase